jgi:hypothetical protein
MNGQSQSKDGFLYQKPELDPMWSSLGKIYTLPAQVSQPIEHMLPKKSSFLTICLADVLSRHPVYPLST